MPLATLEPSTGMTRKVTPSAPVLAMDEVLEQCAVDGDMYAVCTSPRTLAALADGPHTFRAGAVDGAGNADRRRRT